MLNQYVKKQKLIHQQPPITEDVRVVRGWYVRIYVFNRYALVLFPGATPKVRKKKRTGV
tara:strand:- start:167 stop:343 length:177 start_codon:yes stop_codon:yes gene_type:complete